MHCAVPKFPLLALGLLAVGCFNPDPISEEPTSAGSGSGDTGITTTTTTSDPTIDPDGTGSGSGGTGIDPDCGNGVVDAGEDCDDMGESATCDADCTAAECGDETVNAAAGEGCDDGNLSDTDACIDCVPAACGDGLVWAEMEECDDGNAEDGDDCTNACALPVCGDGIAWTVGGAGEDCDDMGESATCDADCTAVECGDGVVNVTAGEQCEDGNDDDTDACVQCLDAFCGDGFVQAMVEECDDGNLMAGDGCDGMCIDENPLLPNVLLCGTSGRDVSTFFPPMSGLTLVNSCIPNADTQAMLVSRTGVNNYNPADLVAYVDGGGIVLTEFSGSDDVFSDLFSAVVDGDFNGSCQDRAPVVFQFNPADQFWVDNAFVPIPQADTGCGRDVSAFPGITPLVGWNNAAVSIAYRDSGAGRLWITDFDWQDTEIAPADPSYANTNELLGYMITHGQ